MLDATTTIFLRNNICFRETLGTRSLLVFPGLINLKRSILEQAETVEDVSYTVTGAVENVYAALVVLLGYTNTFTRTNQWQGQAQYELGEGEICGFRQLEEREGEIELGLYYGKATSRHTRLLFQGAFEKFLRGRDVTVTMYPRWFARMLPRCRTVTWWSRAFAKTSDFSSVANAAAGLTSRPPASRSCSAAVTASGSKVSASVWA